MLDQELIKRAVEVRRIEAETMLNQVKQMYKESQKIAVEHLAKLIGPETVDQENLQLIEAIKREQRDLSYMWDFVIKAQANVDSYKRLTNDSKAMQEFIDRHIGNEKTRAK